MNVAALLIKWRDLVLDASAAQFTDAVGMRFLSEGQRELQRRTLYLWKSFDYSRSPVRTISGSATTTVNPQGIGYDPVTGYLWVADQTLKALLVFQRTDNGNVAPIASIKGAVNTTLTGPHGIAVDPYNREVYVSDGNKIKVWNLTDTGDTAPKRTITGAATTLNDPRGICLAFIGVTAPALYVANRGASSILAWANAHTASGNQAPDQTLSGVLTTLSTPEGVDFYISGSVNELLVADPGVGLLAFSGAAPTGNVAPDRSITGTVNGVAFAPRGVDADTTNAEIYVTVQSVANPRGMAIGVFNRTTSGVVTAYDRTVWLATNQAGLQLGQPEYLVYEPVNGQVYATFDTLGTIAAFVTQFIGRQDIELPPDTIEVEAMTSDGWPARGFDYREGLQPIYPSMRPFQFAVKGSAKSMLLNLYPAPSSNEPIIAFINYETPEIVGTGEIPLFTLQAHQDLIVEYAAMRGKQADSEFEEALAFWERFKTTVDSMRADRESRQAERYPTVRDPEDDDFMGDLYEGHTFIP